ncbi:MAG: hypothetical protein ACREM6_08620 [Vulcanimicrobiaceae bacterium]
MQTFDWSIVLDVGVGVGIFLVGIGVLLLCVRLAGIVRRLHTTLDEVDRQLGSLGPPVAQTLSHVSGIADTADLTLAKLGGVAAHLETVAGHLSKTSAVAQDAITPSLVNLGSTLSGVTAGLKRLTRGKGGGNNAAG